MGISKSSITHKAFRMGLHKSKEQLYNTRSLRCGEKCPTWKGGKKITPNGYVQILKKGYKGTDYNGYIFEHRYIMERQIDRYLNKNEVVHHVNGDKTDNRIENLKLMTNSEHTIFHNVGSKITEVARNNMSIAAKKRWRMI